MVSTLFLRFLTISVTTGIIIATLLLLKPFLGKKYTAKWNYWVWLVLAVRLVLPITMPESNAPIVVQVPQTNMDISSAFVPNGKVHSDATAEEVGTDKKQVNTENSDNVPAIGNFEEESIAPVAEKTQRNYLSELFSQITLQDVATFIWGIGITIYLMYHVIGHSVFRGSMLRMGKEPQREQICVLTEELCKEMGISRHIRIMVCQNASSPLMMGISKSVLVLPKEEYGREELSFILRHELTHCRRNDLLYKGLLLVANAIHWYNPLVWRMCKEANADLERACDEEVLRGASYSDRKLYTMTILEGISERITYQSNLTTYFYGGKKELKNRLADILDMKKKHSGKIALCMMLVCVLAVGSLVACGNVTSDNEGEENNVSVEVLPGEEDTDVTTEPEITQIAFEEIAEEDIYEVKENGNTTYYATRYGIYRVTSGGSECIYDKPGGKEGFSGTEPHMCIYEGRLYFKTDVTYKDGYLDWMDCGIRYVDLETLESDIVMTYVSETSHLLDFWVGDGYLILSTEDSNGEVHEKTVLLQESGKIVYNGKAVEDLTEAERQEYGLETSRWLMENPGKLLSVANRTFAETFVLLDLDGNGTVEEIALQPDETGDIAYAPLDYYLLLEGDKVLKEGFAENMCNDIWALSPNGEDILLVLYADGPSADPYTCFYRYENGSLSEAGDFGADIRACEITGEGIIRGVIRHDVIQTDFITAQWRMNEQKMIEQVPQNEYEFMALNEVQMQQSLTLHTEPGGRETFVLEPQIVKFTKASGDFKWILLETLDGTSGWLEIIDYMTVEDNKSTMDVFDWETMHFAG